MEAPGAHATLDALPNALLGSILELAGRDSGPPLALTCKRFRNVLFSADCASLWIRLRVDASEMLDRCENPRERRAWVRARLAHVALVGPLLASFSAREMRVATALDGLLTKTARSCEELPNDWTPERMLDILSPSRLSELALLLNPFSLAVPSLAQRFPRLATLRLTTQELPATVAATLTSLTQLQSLACSCGVLPSQLLPAVFTLTQLTGLELESVGLPAEVAQLTSLGRLQHLELHCHAAPPPAWPAPGGPVALKVPPPAEMPALASFDYSVAGSMELAGARLRSASYRVAPAAAGGPGAAGSSVATLSIGHIAHLQQQGGLGQLISALLTPGARLDSLLLAHCALRPPTALQSCACLAALPALQLHFSNSDDAALFGAVFGGSYLGPAIDPLLSQAAQLTALDLQGRLTLYGDLPPALAAKRGLRWLRLRQTHLHSMEAGPWLNDLETLEIGGGNFSDAQALPAELEGAPMLRSLRLATNSAVKVRRTDIDLLLSMPELTFLSVSVRIAPGVLAALQAAAPSLRVEQPEG